MVYTTTICKCDLCGKEMKEIDTGHKHYSAYLILGSNANDSNSLKYEDVCDECESAIMEVITKRTNGEVVKPADCFAVFEDVK